MRRCARHVRVTCPERIDQIARRQAEGSAGGRPPACDRAVCAGRAAQHRALLVLAAVVLWLRGDPQDRS